MCHVAAISYVHRGSGNAQTFYNIQACTYVHLLYKNIASYFRKHFSINLRPWIFILIKNHMPWDAVQNCATERSELESALAVSRRSVERITGKNL